VPAAITAAVAKTPYLAVTASQKLVDVRCSQYNGLVFKVDYRVKMRDEVSSAAEAE